MGFFFFLKKKEILGVKKKRIWGWEGRLWREIQDLFLGKRGDFVAKKRFWGQKRRFWGFPMDPPGREWGERKKAKIGIKG